MHIPDGYISPQTAVVMYGAAAPFWYVASQRVKTAISGRSAPLIAIFAAFCFTVQMFNIPVPGGTTAHAVGGTLMAIVLGPWTAVIGVSCALVIQSLLFGDGGITAIGANSFNMAIALPITGYAIYRVIAGKTPSPRRRVIGATIGGYVGINIAGVLTGLELGIQPLFWSDGGHALYSPYGLENTIPAMMLVHLTLAGFAEAVVTGLVVAYLQRSHAEIFADRAGPTPSTERSLGKIGWTFLGLLTVFVILTPIGLLAPGSADFEWGVEELQEMVGYVPEGLAGLSDIWSFAPFRDYQLPGIGTGASLSEQAPSYLLSAVIGIGVIVGIVLLVRLAVRQRGSS